MKAKIISKIMLVLFIISLLSSVLSISALGYTIAKQSYNGVDVDADGILNRSITFKSWSGFSQETRWAIDYASRQWNTRTGVTILYHSPTQYTGNAIPQSVDGQNLITKYDLTNTRYSTYNMLTATLVTPVNSVYYISECDIVVNSARNWNINGTSTTCLDVQNCMTHEFGHMLGLGHSTDSEATMFRGTALGETKKRTIEQDDIYGFFAIYN